MRKGCGARAAGHRTRRGGFRLAARPARDEAPAMDSNHPESAVGSRLLIAAMLLAAVLTILGVALL